MLSVQVSENTSAERASVRVRKCLRIKVLSVQVSENTSAERASV